VDLANRGVLWDNQNKYNIGLDAQFLRNRLSATFDAYKNYGYNLLTNLVSSPSILIGTPVPTENYSNVNAFGYEVSLTWRDRINKDWNYNVTTNFNWSDNKVLKRDVSTGDVGTFKDPTGKSTDMGYYGFHALGMFRTQADVDAWLAKYPNYKIFGNAPAPGMLYFEDVRGPKDASGKYSAPDGTITNDDQTYLTKKANNHYNLGINWGVSYKTLSLNVVMGMSWGGIGAIESSAINPATAYSNRPEFWTDHWTPENPNAKYPAPYYSFSYNVPTDFWWKSSFTFRVTTFNLSYSLPQRIANRAKFQGVKFYLIGTNPINFFNPYDYKDNINSSYDAFPVLRSFSFGVNLSL
jgi:hypothetical protein